MTATATAAPAAPDLAPLADALKPWTLADLRRLLRWAVDGHDVSLATDGPRPARSRWFAAGWVPVLERVHLNDAAAALLIDAGLLPRHERHADGGAFIHADVAREIADALDATEVAP